MDLTNKKVLVIGAARSGISAAKIAKKLGATVILSDAKENLDVNIPDVEIRLGRQTDELLSGVDLIILSPAVPIKIPLLKTAQARGIEIISEVEFAFNLAKSPICAVTGTNGKTTTVTLLGLLLAEKFSRVGVGGNIGVPLSEVALEVGADGCIAAEISSYQMEATKNFKPHISAILNVTPDHLKRHGSMEVYQLMKEKIFAQQTAEDFLVLNYDDEIVREMNARAGCKVVYFSRKIQLNEGAFVENNRLVINFNGRHELCTVDELGIKGGHNVENALAAAMIAYLAGVDTEKISRVLKTFQGVEHRIEFVRELDGVKYFNDSKATNTDSAIKALETFAGHIVLIAGGDDKGTDLTDFLKLVNERVDYLILVGDAAKRFKTCALDKKFPAEKIFDAGYSMQRAVELAKEVSHPPQVVLLSPACASFDMYSDFEERGRDFKRIVHELDEIIIREAIAGDVSRAIVFYFELFERQYKFTIGVERYFIHAGEEIFDDTEGNRLWVAVRNGKVVGSVAIVKRGEGTAQFRMFGVDMSAQGHGLGTKLMQLAMDFCREKNYRHVELWTIDILKPALHLYKKFGFVHVEDKPNTEWANYPIVEEKWIYDN